MAVYLYLTGLRLINVFSSSGVPVGARANCFTTAVLVIDAIQKVFVVYMAIGRYKSALGESRSLAEIRSQYIGNSISLCICFSLYPTTYLVIIWRLAQLGD